MKDFFKQLATQITAIILAALAAAAVSFLQSVAAQTGACPAVATSTTDVAALGAGLKGTHSLFTLLSHRHLS